jgi:hypothetical protein
MKYLLLAGLLLTGAPVFAQGSPALGPETTEPFKGATSLMVHTQDSANVAYKKLANALLAAGYGIEKSDKELGFISTAARPAPKYNMLYACKFYVKPTATGSDIQVSGNFTLPGAAAAASFMAGESTITYRGGANSTLMVCWRAMEQAARSAYPVAPVTYVRLP